MIVKLDTFRSFGPRSRARFFEGRVTPEDLRYSLWPMGARARRNHGLFAGLRIEREHRTVVLDAHGRHFWGTDPDWYGWLLDLAYEAGWNPHT